VHVADAGCGCGARRNETLSENLERRVSGLTRGSLRDVEALPTGSPVYLFNVNDKRLHGVFESVRAAARWPQQPLLCAQPAALAPNQPRRALLRLQTAPGGLNLEPEAWINCSAAKIPGGGSPYPAQARGSSARASRHRSAALALACGAQRLDRACAQRGSRARGRMRAQRAVARAHAAALRAACAADTRCVAKLGLQVRWRETAVRRSLPLPAVRSALHFKDKAKFELVLGTEAAARLATAFTNAPASSGGGAGAGAPGGARG
jgi:hypothetical protein